MQFSFESITQALNILSTFVVSATGLVIALGTVFKPIKNWLFEQLTGRKEIRENIKMFKDDLEDMRNMLRDQSTKSETDRLEQAIMKEALQATVRNELTEIYYRSADRGYIDDYDRENFEKMYIVYTKLGGNSYIHTIHKLILEMPNKRVATKKKTASTKRSTTRKPRRK